MLETEGNEENKEDKQWILGWVILVSMKEPVCPGVSGLLRSLRFLLWIVFLRCSIPHRPSILLEEPVRSAIFTQPLGALVDAAGALFSGHQPSRVRMLFRHDDFSGDTIMYSLPRGGRPLFLKACALAMSGWLLSSSACLAQSHEPVVVDPKVKKSAVDYHNRRRGPSVGTLGYGPPGLYPGFQGFGLGYHLGYGYGGDALGPGTEGGYPFYGGPGYPNCDPRLRRFGGINPFPYNGGPGYSTPDHPNYFGEFGPLVVDQPVIRIADDPGYRYDAAVFGPFTGGVANPEAQFAQFTARAAAGAESMRLRPASPPVTPVNPPADPRLGPSTYIVPSATQEKTSLSAPLQLLGIDEEPVIGSDGIPGIRVSTVRAGTVAERAGLHAGDVIHSVNGYLTTDPGNLAWIIATKAPNGTLLMNVRNANDGKVDVVAARLR
jgi:hypothetical protein